MPYKDPEQAKVYAKNYYEKNKAKAKAAAKRHYEKDKAGNVVKPQTQRGECK